MTWTPKLKGVYPDNSFFYVPYVLDLANPARLVLGTDSVYESLDRADSWTLLSVPFFGGWNTSAVIDSLALCGVNSDTIYASAGGKVFATFNHGGFWTERDIPGVSDNVQALQLDPASNLTVYAVRARIGGGHVFMTTDGGVGWKDISGDLPDLPAYCVVLDPRTSPHALYVGNYNGVYVTKNLGAHWSRVGTGLPNALVLDLEENTDLNVLAAGTHGRGVWEISLNTASGTAPTLSMGAVGNHTLTLSWPASAIGFTLQTATSLQPPINWQTVTNSPSQSGESLTVNIPTTNLIQFFRLVR
jgi:photosystem II stability/assembly factor-like uncharacterized protein